MSYSVTGQLAVVLGSNGQRQYFYKGAPLPADTPGGEITRLLGLGLIALDGAPGTPVSGADAVFTSANTDTSGASVGSVPTVDVVSPLHLKLRAPLVLRPEDYGATADGTTDDGAAINSCFTAAQAAGGVAWFTPGKTYSTTIALTWATGPAQIEGNNATIQSTINTGDILSIGTYDATGATLTTGGYVRRLNIRGPGVDDSNALAPTNYKAALVVNSTRHFRVEDVYAQRIDIGFDLRGNCYGTKLIRARTGVTVNVGLLLRGGTAGSGSDVLIEGFWGGGAKSAFWMEAGGGGYTFVGCKPGAGHSTYAAAQDHLGVFLVGPTYAPVTTTSGSTAVGAATITVASGSAITGSSVVINGQEIIISSKSGNVLTVPTSGAGSVTATIASGSGVQDVRGGVGSLAVVGGGIEGATRVHAVRLFADSVGVAFTDFSFNSNGSSGGGTNQMIQVLKHSRGGSPSISFRRCSVQGNWIGTVPLTVTTGLSFSPQVWEEGTTHGAGSSPTFNTVTMGLIDRPMSSWSSTPGATAVIGSGGLLLGGYGFRVNAGAVQVSTDGTLASWTTINDTGTWLTLPTQYQNTVPYQMLLSDVGKLTAYDVNTTAGTYTLPPVGTTPAGTVITVAQTFSGPLTVNKGTADGIRVAGTGIVNNVVLTSQGIVQFVKDPGTRWFALPIGGSASIASTS